jgi:hypothetical protein
MSLSHRWFTTFFYFSEGGAYELIFEDSGRFYLRGFASYWSSNNYKWILDIVPYYTKIASFSPDVNVMPQIPKYITPRTGTRKMHKKVE